MNFGAILADTTDTPKQKYNNLDNILTDASVFWPKMTILADITCFGQMTDTEKSLPIHYQLIFGRNEKADIRPTPNLV